MPGHRWIAAALLALASPRVDAQDQPAATTVALSGRAVTADGQPIAGAGVVFARLDDWTTDALLGDAPLRTDSSGRFALEVPARAATTPQPLRLLLAARGFAAIAPSITWKFADNAPGENKKRAPTDLGDLVLPASARLVGRVRDTNGKPVAGAAIVARDLLDETFTGTGQMSGALCRAVSDKSGIFQLVATLPCAVRLDVNAPGCLRQQVSPVAIGSPLELTLTPGGEISGRVLDPEGRSVAQATVVALYERSGPATTVTTESDGSFRLPLEYAGRWRVSAHTATKSAVAGLRGSSAVLEGPAANLEVALATDIKKNEGEATAERLRVLAVSATTGEPIAGFRAGSTFHDYANRNAAYLEWSLARQLRDLEPTVGDEAVITRNGTATTGAVRVTARGFAPKTELAFEWPAAKDDGALPELVLKLEPEATIVGKVVDERTGAPIAGARIFARPRTDQGTFMPNEDELLLGATTSAADGSFMLRELGDGNWSMTCRHPQRPKSPATNFTLTPREQRNGVELRLPPGARVAGRITGMPLPAGSRVFLHLLPRQRFGAGAIAQISSSNAMPTDAQALGSDGNFAFDGVGFDHFMVVLLLPSPPRCGGSLAVPIEPIRVRAAGIQRDFDASEDAGSRIVGRLSFAAAEVPFDRLVVVAQEVDERTTSSLFSTRQLGGPRSFVTADGRFTLGVLPGQHRLVVVDVATRLVLAWTKDPVVVKSGAEATAELSAELATIDVEFAPETAGKPMATVDRLEVRVKTKLDANQKLPGNDNYDQGCGVAIAAGQQSVRLCVPAGMVAVLARSSVGQMRLDERQAQNEPLGREQIEVASGDQKTVRVLLGPPPEVVPARADPEREAKD